LPELHGWSQTSLHFLFLSFNSLSLSKSDLLRRRSENSRWKGSFSSSYKGALARASPVSPKGWRCNFLTNPETPKVAKSRTLPAMSKANNQISYASFMVSVAQEWRSPLASSAPVLPLGQIDLDSSDDQ
jgi:hypothetical protein